MKKVILNIFVLIPLALFMMVYVDGQSEKKIVKESKTSPSKITIQHSSEKHNLPAKVIKKDLVAEKKNQKANILPGL